MSMPGKEAEVPAVVAGVEDELVVLVSRYVRRRLNYYLSFSDTGNEIAKEFFLVIEKGEL